MKQILFILIVAMTCLPGCVRESIPIPAAKQLTGRTWVLHAYGQDSDGNGQIDQFENLVQPCETDNRYIFRPDGTGTVYDHVLSCPAGVPEFSFTWTLSHHDSILDLQYSVNRMLRLDEHELIIYPENQSNDPVKWLTVFRP